MLWTNCNKRVLLYFLEKHHLEHKEEEDMEHNQMVADIKIIWVKRKVPTEKVKDQQVADIHG